jgi:MFS transporter, ACS family, glucarate transporter
MQPATTTSRSSATPPSNARRKVIWFAVTLAILAYVDRVCISMAAPEISKDLGLDKAQMGYVFGAFAVAYALFEIPGGWLGDWMGPRKVLMRIVIWWSFFTAATGWMFNYWSMLATRFLFGAGEAGCFPNITKAFSTWLPLEERVRAQGILWMAARWGGAFTPPLVIWIFKVMDWRMAFTIFGLIGTIWAYFFYRWFRDNPQEHPEVNAGERELIALTAHPASGHGDVPWGKLLASRSVWLLWLQYFLLSFPWYFYPTWLPTYLQEFHKVDRTTSGYYAILPLFLGGVGSLTCGFLSTKLSKRWNDIGRSRRTLSTVGFGGAAVMMFIAIQVKDPLWAMIGLGLSSFCNDLVMPNAWGACMDVGGKYAGTLSGSMNMMGNIAGFVAPVLGGLILRETGNDWNLFITIMASVYVLGMLTWPFIDPVTPLEKGN